MQRIKKAFVFIFSRVKTRLSLDELQRDIYIVTKKKSFYHFRNQYISKKLNNKPYNQEKKPCSRTFEYFVHKTNSESLFRENYDIINISAAVKKSFAMFSVEEDNIFGKRLTNSLVISVQHFKMSCLTLVRKYSLMSLQSVGMDWVTSLRSQMKNGKVLWKNSVSSWGPLALTLSSLEQSLIHWDNFIIKLRNVKKCFPFLHRAR